MNNQQTQEAVSAKIPAYEGSKPYIFISYRHLDSPRVMAVIESLRMRKNPYLMWYDEGIPPGSEWQLNISEHLKHSGAVVYFISKDFLKSVNCDNEVKNRFSNEKEGDSKDIFVFALDEAEHKDLEGYPVVRTVEELVALLPDKYIGTDDDYKRSGLLVRNGNIWNALIPIFIALAAAFGVAVYGLLTGWFDDYINPETEPLHLVSWEDVRYDEDEDMGSIIDVPITRYDETPETEAVLRLQGVEIPWKEIEFKNSDSKRMLCNALGLDENAKITYTDIEYNTDIHELTFDEINDEVISLVSRYQYLRKLYIKSGTFTTLTPLSKAQNLRRVYLSKDAWITNKPVVQSLRTSEEEDNYYRVFRVYIVE